MSREPFVAVSKSVCSHSPRKKQSAHKQRSTSIDCLICCSCWLKSATITEPTTCCGCREPIARRHTTPVAVVGQVLNLPVNHRLRFRVNHEMVNNCDISRVRSQARIG